MGSTSRVSLSSSRSPPSLHATEQGKRAPAPGSSCASPSAGGSSRSVPNPHRPPRQRRATPAGSLHGWGPVAEQGWLLAAAQSSQAGMTDQYIWDDQNTALREIAQHYATLRDEHDIDPSRVVLGGFSMGGETALRAALLGTMPARGFILLGPGGPTIDTPDEWLPLMRTSTGARSAQLSGPRRGRQHYPPRRDTRHRRLPQRARASPAS